MGRWTKVEDAKLAKLFQDNILDPSDTQTKTIQKAREDHFPGFSYTNFGPLFRKKVREWNINNSLSGQRRGPVPARKLLFLLHFYGHRSISPHSCFRLLLSPFCCRVVDPAAQALQQLPPRAPPVAASRGIDLLGDSEQEDGDNDNEEEIFQEEEDEQEQDQDDDDRDIPELTDALNDVMVVPTAMKIICPVLQYTYFDTRGQEKITVDFLVPAGTCEEEIKPKVDKSGMFLELCWTAPDFFFSEHRLSVTKNIKMSHYKAIALAKAGREMKKDYKNEDIVCIQRVKLPFKVEQGLCTDDGPGSELQLFEHDDAKMRILGQCHLIFSVNLVATVKPHKKPIVASPVRIFKSPLEAAQIQRRGRNAATPGEGQGNQQGEEAYNLVEDSFYADLIS
jgi:hypothetical protein